MQKFVRRLYVLVLTSFLLTFTTVTTYASETNPTIEDNSSYIIITDEDGILYGMYEEEGKLVISELYTERFGGGIGRCPASDYKTF